MFPCTSSSGNNRQACFFADEDYRNYLDWLEEYAAKTGCLVHAYVLMTNHVHLLISTARTDGVTHRRGQVLQSNILRART